MRKTLFRGLILGGCALTFAATQPVLAQAPGGGQSAPQQQQQPQQQSPNANAPGGLNNPDAGTGTSTSRVDDKKFVKNAAMGGMMEVELGKIAAAKGGSEGVKQFGQKMVDDHSKANDQLKEVAGKEHMDLPSALDSKHQSKLDKMSGLSGAAFDKAYVKDMVKDHEQDVSEFQTEAQNGTNPDIKQFAATTLPTLKEHLNMIKDLNKKKE